MAILLKTASVRVSSIQIIQVRVQNKGKSVWKSRYDGDVSPTQLDVGFYLHRRGRTSINLVFLVPLNPFKLPSCDGSTTKSLHEDICRDNSTTDPASDEEKTGKGKKNGNAKGLQHNPANQGGNNKRKANGSSEFVANAQGNNQ